MAAFTVTWGHLGDRVAVSLTAHSQDFLWSSNFQGPTHLQHLASRISTKAKETIRSAFQGCQDGMCICSCGHLQLNLTHQQSKGWCLVPSRGRGCSGHPEPPWIAPFCDCWHIVLYCSFHVFRWPVHGPCHKAATSADHRCPRTDGRSTPQGSPARCGPERLEILWNEGFFHGKILCDRRALTIEGRQLAVTWGAT